MSRYTIELYHLQRDAVYNSLNEYRSEKIRERYSNITLGFNSGQQAKSTFHMLKNDNHAFKKVAVFDQESDDISKIFDLTHHREDYEWISNLPSSATYTGELDICKSSSVGDFMIVKDNENPDIESKIYAFAFDGYNEFGSLIRRRILEIIENPKDKVISKPKV